MEHDFEFDEKKCKPAFQRNNLLPVEVPKLVILLA